MQPLFLKYWVKTIRYEEFWV